jgi:Mpv17 / PMP22 family
MIMVCCFSYLGIANRDSIAVILAKIQENLFIAVAASWKKWPLVHAIQSRSIATKYPIIYISCIEVVSSCSSPFRAIDESESRTKEETSHHGRRHDNQWSQIQSMLCPASAW